MKRQYLVNPNMSMRHWNDVAMEKSNIILAPENIFPGDTGTVHQWDFTQNLIYNKSAVLKN